MAARDPQTPSPEPDSPALAMRALGAWSSGELRSDDRYTRIRFIIGSEGALVLPASTDMLKAIDSALSIPSEGEPILELAVSPEPLADDPAGEAARDRWRIYHGEPTEARWAVLEIDSARFHGEIIDGQAMQRANPLAAIEPRLCGVLNRSHRQAIQATLEADLDIDSTDARVVGIDPDGLDIRNRFDVVRLEFDQRIDKPDQAERAVFDRLSVVGD